MTVVDGLGAIPPSWSIQRGRRTLSLQRRPVHLDDRIVTAFRDGRVTLRVNRRVEGFTEAVQEIGYQGVEPGDLVVHSMDAFAGAIGVSDSRGKMSPVVHIYRPREDGDSRYFAYVLRALAWSNYIQSLAKGIRERSTSFDRVTLADMDLPVPPISVQRQIADFLDDQVIHIDQAIMLAKRQAPTVAELFARRLFDLLLESSSRSVPLSAVTKIIDTEHRTAPAEAGGQYWSAGTGSIREGRLMPELLTEISRETYLEWSRRGKPVPGDVLLTREAPVGEVALVRDTNTRLAIGQRVVLLKPTPELLLGEYLLAFLLSPHFRRTVEDLTQGSLHPHLNMADISRVRLPLIRIEEQSRVAREVMRLLEHKRTATDHYSYRVGLLEERKRALITAAVTGDFEVSSASSRALR